VRPYRDYAQRLEHLTASVTVPSTRLEVAVRRDDWEQASRALVAATEAVLARCGATVSYVERTELPKGALKLAVIGFGGENMRGMLALSLEPSLLARTCPAADSHDDWLCELSNLLLGRFKGDLLRLGITVHLSTPMLVEGAEVSLDTYAVAAIVHRFSSDRGETLFVVLDAVAETATRVRESNLPLAGEGSVVLFEGGDPHA
jgi:CheY-specific phosphatase CheX